MIASRADHIPSHYRFERQQSRSMRDAEWETRGRGMPESWLSVIANTIGLLMFMAAVWVLA